MRPLLAFVLLPSLAFAAPPTPPAGLDRACTALLPAPTPTEQLVRAWEATTDHPACASLAEGAWCAYEDARLAVTAGSALALVPVESAAKGDASRTVFVGTWFDLGAGDSDTVELAFGGPIVQLRRVSKGVQIKGNYAPPPPGSSTGTLVIDVEGQVVKLPVVVSARRDAAPVTVTAVAPGPDDVAVWEFVLRVGRTKDGVLTAGGTMTHKAPKIDLNP